MPVSVFRFKIHEMENLNQRKRKFCDAVVCEYLSKLIQIKTDKFIVAKTLERHKKERRKFSVSSLFTITVKLY